MRSVYVGTLLLWWCTAQETGYLLGVYRLVAGVQIRQVRVSNDSCLERRFLSDCLTSTINNVTACRPRYALWAFAPPRQLC